MNRGSANILLIIGVIVVLGGVGGWWYLNNRSRGYQTIAVSPQSGNAPLTVKISPPTQWQNVFRKDCDNAEQDKTMAFGGREFVVDWDDGSITNDSNPKCGLVHVYQNAGSYMIGAKVMDFSDIPAFDGKFTRDLWRGTANVTVSKVN